MGCHMLGPDNIKARPTVKVQSIVVDKQINYYDIDSYRKLQIGRSSYLNEIVGKHM